MSGEHFEHLEQPDGVVGRAAEPARDPDIPSPTLAGAHGSAQPGAASSFLAMPISDLQHLAGNAAVVQLLAREARSARPPAEAPAPPHSVQRVIGTPRSELPEGYSAMSDAEKAIAISDLLGKGASGGALYLAWSQLGDSLGIAHQDPNLFKNSLLKNSSIGDLAPFADLKSRFRAAVESKAMDHLASNKMAVAAEREKTAVPTTGQHAGETASPDEEVQKIQAAADEMARIKLGKAALQGLQVGESPKGGGPMLEATAPVYFSPGSPPWRSTAGCPSYEETLQKWNALVASESTLVKAHPSAAFFIGEGGDPSKITSDKEIRVARAEIARALDDLDEKINAAIPKIGHGVNFADLVPIQQELMAGPVWSKPVEMAVAKEAVTDANVANLLKALGVGTLAAAAFVLAEFASGGLATFLFAAGAGVSGGMAAADWKKYSDLAAAQKGAIDPAVQLVSGEQVGEAMITAVLDTVFAFIDLWQGAKGVAKGAEAAAVAAKGGKEVIEGGKAGVEAGAAAMLKNLQASDKPAEVLAKAAAEVGPTRVQELSGLPFERLAEIAGGKDTPLGQQFLLMAEKGAGAMTEEVQVLVAKLPTLASIASTEEGDKVLAAALSQYGYRGTVDMAGGWKALRQTAAIKGASGKALEGWRASIVQELDAYLQQEMGKIVRTGREGAEHDLDVQVFGDAAAELKRKGEGWLAGRLGTDVTGAERLLDATVFIDPSRAHLVDLMKGIGADAQAQIRAEMAAIEPRLILEARLTAARKYGPEAVDRVMKDAEAAGIKDLREFEPLSPAVQQEYAAKIDGWMKELSRPDVAADAGRKTALIRDISRTQALIDASHADAYVGGGVAVWVTGRDVDVAKIAEALNVAASDLTKFTAAQRISAALAEGKWLDAAVGELAVATGDDAAALARSVRDIGKHGSRAARVLRVEGAGNVGRLTDLMNTLEVYAAMTPTELKAIVDSGTLAAMRGEVTSLLDGLSSATGAAISNLRRDADTLGVAITEMADFQAWLKWRTKFEHLTATASGATAAKIRAIETAVEAAQQESRMPPKEPPAVYPTPTPQSAAPEQPSPAPSSSQSQQQSPLEEPQSIAP